MNADVTNPQQRRYGSEAINEIEFEVDSSDACFVCLPWVTQAGEPIARPIVALGAISANTVPLWVAKEQGFFRKYGFDPQLVFIIAGRAAQAMLAGEVNIGTIGSTHVINVVTAGGDLTMVLGMENRLNYQLVGRPSVRNAEELKGKKVAIGTPSGSASLATYVALDYLGLNPRRDNITLLGIGGTQERLGALLAGSVDATSLGPETAQVAVDQGYPILLDTAKENVPFQSAGLVLSRKLLKSNPQFGENFARAIVEAVAYVHNPANKKIVIQTIGKNLRLDKADRLEKAYQTVVQEIPRKPCPSIPGVTSAINLMGQHGLNPKAAQLKPDDIVDLSLCEKFEESGLFERLYQAW